jgi:filamin
MLGWVNGLMPELSVSNFTTDWNSGVNLSALVDHIQPGLFPNYASLNPSNAVENCTKAMDVAEEHLTVPKILDPEDLANPLIDDRSVMTYISYFCSSYSDRLLTWVQRKIPRCNVTNFTTDWNNGLALSALVDAVRPGLIPNHADLPKAKSLQNVQQAMSIAEERLGVQCLLSPEEMTDPEVDQLIVMSYITQFQTATLTALARKCHASNIPNMVAVGTTVEFRVDTTESGEGSVDIAVKKSDGNPDTIDVTQPSAGLYHVAFTPTIPGVYEVMVSLNGDPIREMPRNISVCDISKCTFSKPFPKFIPVNSPFDFSMDTSRAGDGKLDVSLMEESGLVLPTEETKDEHGLTMFTFTPLKVGKLVVDVKFADTKVPGSPFIVAATDSSKIAVFGPSLLSGQGQVRKPVEFTILTKDAGDGPIEVEAKGPTAACAVSLEKNEEDTDTFSARFIPWEVGHHQVNVLFAGEKAGDSPYAVNVSDTSQVTVYGPRLLSGRGKLGEPIDFSIHMKDSGTGEPNIEVRGPTAVCEVDLSRKEDDPCVFVARFVPWQVGSHRVDVMVYGEPVSNSPFSINITDSQCDIVGLSPTLTSGVPVTFQIHASQNGDTKLAASVEGPSGTVCPVNLTEREENSGLYDATFLPSDVGKHIIQVTLDREPVDNGPWTVDVVDPSSCIFTERPNDEIQMGSPTSFSVDCTKAGTGHLGVRVKSSITQTPLPIDVHEPETGIHSVTFTPMEIGQLRVEAKWQGQHIPSSPFEISVCDATQVSAYGAGLATGKGIVGQPVQFTIQAKYAGNGKMKVTARGPTALYAVSLTDEEGIHNAEFVPWETGEHVISVSFGGTEIPNSPYKLMIETVSDVNQIEASGEGLTTAFTGEEALFHLQAQEGGLIERGAFDCIAQGVKCNAAVELNDLGGGAYSGSYITLVPGAYLLIIKCMNKNIPNSPFKVTAFNRPDASKCVVEGAILTAGAALLTNRPVNFRVHTKDAGHGKLRVTATSQTGASVKVFTANDGEGSYSFRFEPEHPGKYTVNVRWSDLHVPGSPFKVKVWPPPDASKVKVFGPGLNSCKVGDMGEFSVNTKDAGLGTLLVRVHGIKDAFKVQLEIPDEKNPRLVRAWYSPTEPGDYVTVIKWEGVEVPGSPFEVKIVDRNDLRVHQGTDLSISVVKKDSQLDVPQSGNARRKARQQEFAPSRPRVSRKKSTEARVESGAQLGKVSIDVTATKYAGAKMKLARKMSEPGSQTMAHDAYYSSGHHPTPYLTSRVLTLDADEPPPLSMDPRDKRRSKKGKKLKRSSTDPQEIGLYTRLGQQPGHWPLGGQTTGFPGSRYPPQMYPPGIAAERGYHKVSQMGHNLEEESKKKRGKKKTKT